MSFFDFENEDVIETEPESNSIDVPVVEVSEPTGNAFERNIIVPIDGNEHVVFPKSIAYSPGNDVLSKIDEIEQHKATMAAEELRIKQINEQMAAIREEMQNKLNALATERSEIDAQIFDKRRKLRALTLELHAAEKLFKQALDNEKITKEFQQNAKHFDDVSAGLAWREFAFPHQIEGAKLLANAKRAILGDKMGLGKSLTSLITADMLQVSRLLIIVPDDVVSNFVNEVHHWANHRNVIMLGKLPKAQRHMMIELLKMSTEYTVVVNYSAWRRDKVLIEALIGMRFQMVVMDEAHQIKETSTNAYRGCREIITAQNSCPVCASKIERKHLTGERVEELRSMNKYRASREYWACTNTHTCGWDEIADYEQDVYRGWDALSSIKYVIPMTGTVILNKPTDIYALLSLIDPRNFDNKNDFVRMYCWKDYDNKIKFKPGGMESLVNKLGNRYIARDRNSAGVVLPKQNIVRHNIEIDRIQYAKQYEVIEQLSKHAMLMLQSGKQMPILATIALITRKRQANVWPAGITFKDEEGNVVFSVGEDVRESIKLDRLINLNESDENGSYSGLIPEITADGNMELGERVVVFSQFKEPLKELEARLNAAGISTVRFDGDTPNEIRNQVKVDFDRKMCDQPGYEAKWQVVLCNYKTGGVGLNFTGATQMVILDREWNGGKEDQAYGRIDRMGQTEETTVHILNLERTIDTWMDNLIEDKRNMVNGFESTAELSSALLEAMTKGDMI